MFKGWNGILSLGQGFGFVFACSLILGAGCSRLGNSSDVHKLQIAIWGNYLPETLIKDFEKETHSQVSVSNYSSNEELLAKLQAGGTHFDLVVPSDYMVEILIRGQLLSKLNPSLIPHASGIKDSLLRKSFDPRNEFSLPYAWSTTGIVINRSRVTTPLRSWKDFFESPELAGKIAVLDDVRELTGVILKMKGKSVNSESAQELSRAKDYLLKVRKSIRMFTSDPIEALLNEEILAAHTYSTDAYQVIAQGKEKGKTFEYILPSEGNTMAIDNFAIPVSAKNPKLAHLFINFLMGADQQRELSSKIKNGPILKQTSLPEGMSDSPDLFKKFEMIKDVGAASEIYDRILTEVKSST